MSPLRLTAAEIGLIAHRLLQTGQEAAVQGLTSHGVFLKLSNSRVLFVTGDPWRGPLTINLPAWQAALGDLQPGDPLAIRAGSLHFPTLDLEIGILSSSVWQAPAPPRPPSDRSRRGQALAALVKLRSQAAARRDGLFFLLAPEPAGHPADSSSTIQDTPINDYAKFRTSLTSSQPSRISSTLLPFLGSGAGLTPSGDDLVTGFLLALNRWGGELAPQLKPAEINRTLQREAVLRTTSLSASLIACACQGQADERLVLALDGLVTGSAPVSECLAALASYGGSSGFDALVGMAALILR